MFFVSSIRRRLATGFGIFAVAVLALTGLGYLGLYWHDTAVTELKSVLYGPEQHQNQATRSLHQVVELALSDRELRTVTDTTVAAISRSHKELGEFLGDIRDLPPSPILHENSGNIQLTIRSIRMELMAMSSRAAKVYKANMTNAEQRRHFQQDVLQTIGSILNSLGRLPDFRDTRTTTADLSNKYEHSETLRTALILIAVSTGAFFALTLWGGFQWISNPVRELRKGASRIAEGDHEFRIERVSPWDDEFTQLQANINLMADRFVESERDLQEKVHERCNQMMRSERLAGIGFLSTGVAHEINNPLSIIRVAADTLEFRLQEHLPDDPEEREAISERVKMIREEAVRCGDITQRILSFARGEQTDMQRDNLTDVIDSVLAMVRTNPDFRDRSLQFDRVAPLELMMNAAQMKQVMLNVVCNSLQATNEGGRVDIRLVERVDWVIIEVQDDGCGMSEETMEKLFDPFYSTKVPGKGTGLGMPITHRIVADHEGTIEPVSAGEGQGSLIRIRLPRRVVERSVA